MVQCGVVAAWAGFLRGRWELATALLVANAVSGFDWFGRVAGSVVTEAPGARAWMNATSELAGGGDLMDLPPAWTSCTAPPDPQPGRSVTRCGPQLRGSPRCTTTAPSASRTSTSPCRRRARAAAGPGRLGQVQPALGAGRACPPHRAGPLERPARRRPAGRAATRPGRPHRAGAAGALRHLHRQHRPRSRRPEVGRARDGPDGARRRRGGRPRRTRRPPGFASPVGRCSGWPWPGRWPATPSCCWPTTSPRPSTPPPRSSWAALRSGGKTVIGATSKAAALAQADRVVVLDGGRVVETAPCSASLSQRWGHLVDLRAKPAAVAWVDVRNDEPFAQTEGDREATNTVSGRWVSRPPGRPLARRIEIEHTAPRPRKTNS